MNTLYYGDNLEILKNKINDGSIDLIYLDPPFQSGKSYNVIFKNVEEADAQIRAFEDTWKWGDEAEATYKGLIEGTITRAKVSNKVVELIKLLRDYLQECDMMAYLVMMAPRLIEMRRVLKDSGSIYLHCDPRASHYLKLLMDAVFGARNFINEIIWGYRTGGVGKRRWARKHDVILFYAKSDKYFFKPQKERVYYEKPFFNPKRDEQGRYYADVYMRDVWDDIKPVINVSNERVGYPTQKPIELLERIITVSSKEGDVVLDPFCGCGTAIAAAQGLGRKWIGIDITYLAINVIMDRLAKSNLKVGKDYRIVGIPADLYGAKQLLKQNPYDFQVWCVTKLRGVPTDKRSGDKGVDGCITFMKDSKRAGKIVIQVKGTKEVSPSMVRDLRGTMASQKADMAILVTFKVTDGMKQEALRAGKIKFYGQEFDKIQVVTVEQLFNDSPVKIPLSYDIYQQSGIEQKTEQERLFKERQ